MSVLSGVRMKEALRKKKTKQNKTKNKNVPDTCFVDTKTKEDIFTTTERFFFYLIRNCHLKVTRK